MPWLPAAVGAGLAIYKGATSGGDSSGPADPNPGAGQEIVDNTKDNDFSWGGDNGQVRNPAFDPKKPEGPGNSLFLQGQTGAQKDAARYQGMGANWANMQAPTTDYATADQARGSQADALSAMQQAANGNAPSQAAVLMRQGNDQAIANQMSMAAGARGAGAMAGAQQQAMGNASNMSTQNLNNTGALRAQEMAQARGAYMQGASGMRGQDQTQAQYLSGLAMQQRQLGLQGQMGFENMAYNAKDAQMRARLAKQGVDESHWATQSNMDENSVNNAYKHGTDAAQAGASLLSATSDVRAKDDVQFEGVDPLSKMRGR